MAYGTIQALYRAYLREIRRLPHLYLRQFFRSKISADVRTILKSKGAARRERKLERMSKELRRVEAANCGKTRAFDYILDLAYGRRGRLKWEIMKPILSDPTAKIPPRIIPEVKKSSPPIFSPELRALLLSTYSRESKALRPQSIITPPTLPAQADPTSQEACLLGPLSKRREVNIRWRYFVNEWKKIRPPLEVFVKGPSDQIPRDEFQAHLPSFGIRKVGLQGYKVFEDIERMADVSSTPVALTRKEKQTKAIEKPSLKPSSTCPPRWVRRRYQSLLARTPTLSYVHSDDGRPDPGYLVDISPKAVGSFRRPEIDSSALAWYESTSGDDSKRRKSNKWHL